MTTMDPTDRAIMHYLSSYISEHGHPPTLRETTRALGLTAMSVTASRLRSLKDRGYVWHRVGQPHTLRILRDVP